MPLAHGRFGVHILFVGPSVNDSIFSSGCTEHWHLYAHAGMAGDREQGVLNADMTKKLHIED